MNPFEPPGDQASEKRSEPKPAERGIPSGVLIGGAVMFLLGAVVRWQAALDANGVRDGLVLGGVGALLLVSGVILRISRNA